MKRTPTIDMAQQNNAPQSVIKNPVKEGFLQKQSVFTLFLWFMDFIAVQRGWAIIWFFPCTGRHLRNWRARWVVLEGSTLHTFKKEKDYANPTEIIDLKVFSSVKSSEDHTHKPFSFDVYSPESRFSFVAKSENDKEDWIRHIGKAIVLSNTKVWWWIDIPSLCQFCPSFHRFNPSSWVLHPP